MSVLDKSMIRFDFDRRCYSCFACKDQCPSGAITMNDDLHPVIDEARCVDCSLCENVCIELNAPTEVEMLNCRAGYIVKNKSDEVRRLSSSGGVFFQLAQTVIRAGGYVCGCIYDEQFMPKHVVTNDIGTCHQMMGSKYVKSDLTGCLAQIKKLIKDGNTILFTGVACQVAAIKQSISSERLLTVAVVCHGSMERSIWKKYLQEEAERGRIQAVTMRDKSRGYLNYGLKFVFEDHSEHITYRKTDGYFLRCFTDGLFDRERCLTCAYKGSQIPSDLLLGDAWGMDQVFPEFVDDNGCSAVMILTRAGEQLYDSAADAFWQKEVDSTVLIRTNPRIMTPDDRNPFLKGFRRKVDGKRVNIHKLTEQYAKPTMKNRIKWKLAHVFVRRYV